VSVARKYESLYESNVERITISIDKHTLDWIKKVAGKRGVSKFLADLARKELARADVLEMLDELDEKYGRPTRAQRERIYRDMRRLSGHGR
jgi:hypothetical protein